MLSVKEAAAGNGALSKVLQELQGLRIAILAGTTAATAIAVSGIEDDDSILSVLRLASGVPTDVTSEASIASRKATGTLTLAGIVAGDVVGVNGQNYTAVAFTQNTSNAGQLAPRSFAVGASDTATAVNLAKAINASDPAVTATPAAAVVTIQAKARGTGGNSIALVVTGSNAHATRSAATLAGGTATNSISLSTTNTSTNQLILYWYKRPAVAV